VSGEQSADTVVFFFIPDSFDTNRVRQKNQSIVFHFLRTQLREYLAVAVCRSVPLAEQIQVSRRTIRLRGPQLNEKRL
jgi:hypothetical protein